MLFDAKRQTLAATIAPALESVGKAAAAVIALALLAVVISVAALVVAARRSTG